MVLRNKQYYCSGDFLYNMFIALAFIVFLVVAMYAAWRFEKLTAAGSLTGGLLAACIFAGVSLSGIYLLAAFFVMGTLATSLKRQMKEQASLQDENRGRRDAWQVIANGACAAIIGLIAFIFPIKLDLFELMIAGAFSAASADTLSSELGNIYGSKYINILTLKEDKRGLDGVISLEGTIAGLGGSLVIALLFSSCTGNYAMIWVLLVAGLLGNIADSILGATLEREGKLGNNTVNFINTMVGAICAALLFVLYNLDFVKP